MEQESIVQLTADIVAAHVANNNVAVGDVATLVRTVHEALTALGQAPAPAEPEAKTPAVSVRASVKPDYLVCMECGRKQKTLKRHLMTAHNMTPNQYRADYGLPDSYPMTAANYSERRRTLAHSIGLGRKGKGAAPAAQAAPKRRGRKPKAG